MKRLINKKTGEVAILDLYFNTITFSNSKTTHKVTIQKDSSTHKITKISASPDPIPTPNEIKSELGSNPSTTSSDTIPSKKESTPQPINNPINSNPIEPDFTIIDDFSKFEMIPETELFFSPDPLNPSLFTPTYKESA